MKNSIIEEITIIILSSIILSFSYSFLEKDLFFKSFICFLIIFIVYVSVSKIIAYYYEANAKLQIWREQQYGFPKESHFSTPIPVGLILSILIPFLSIGKFMWLAVTETDITARKERVARRHGAFSFVELNEYHIAFICASSIFSLIFLSFIAYLLNFPLLSKLSIYFAFFNLIPLSSLDGSKIFFGERLLWIILFIICSCGVFYSLFLV